MATKIQKTPPAKKREKQEVDKKKKSANPRGANQTKKTSSAVGQVQEASSVSAAKSLKKQSSARTKKAIRNAENKIAKEASQQAKQIQANPAETSGKITASKKTASKKTGKAPVSKNNTRKAPANSRGANQTKKTGKQASRQWPATKKKSSTIKPGEKPPIVKSPKHAEDNYYKIVQSKKLTPQQSVDPPVRSFLKAIEKYIHNDLFVDKNASILICVSGGVDSVTLLDVLAVLSVTYCFKLYIAHFNHQLRGKNSEEDKAFVKELAKSYGIPFFSESANVAQYVEKNSLSIEQAARSLRYKFFERIAVRHKANLVAIAHSLDDSAETFLINLFRGSGLTGLSGIPSRRKFVKDTYLIRPFLKHKKSEIIRYARKRNLEWREDESNKSDDFTRNRVRNDLLPKLQKDFTPAIIEILNRTARHLNGADSFISEYVSDRLQYLVVDKTSDRFAVKLPLLGTYNEFIQGEIIQAALSKYYRLPIQSFNVIDRIIGLNKSPVGAICEVGDNIIVLRDRQLLIFSRKRDTFDFDEVIDTTGKFGIGRMKLILEEVGRKDVIFTDNPNVEYFDMEFMPRKLQLRTWRKGDIFKPIGMDGSVKISDLLTNLKIPLIDKQDVLVLSDRIDIFWVCGQRMGEKYKISGKSKKVLRAEYVNNQ